LLIGGSIRTSPLYWEAVNTIQQPTEELYFEQLCLRHKEDTTWRRYSDGNGVKQARMV
jgi:hypothetical protein